MNKPQRIKTDTRMTFAVWSFVAVVLLSMIIGLSYVVGWLI